MLRSLTVRLLAALVVLLALWLMIHGAAAVPADFTYNVDGAAVAVNNVCGPGGQFVYLDLTATDGHARWYDAAGLIGQFDSVTFTAESTPAFPRQGTRFLWGSHGPGDVAHITAASAPPASCIADGQLAPLVFDRLGNVDHVPLLLQPYTAPTWPPQPDR